MKLLQFTPNLMVQNVSRTTLFYTNLFDMQIEYLVRDGGESDTSFDTEVKEGVVYQYAGLRLGEFRLGIQTEKSIEHDVPELVGIKPGSLSGTIYVEVDDLEACKKKIQEHEFRDAGTSWYGMKEIYLKDPNGYILCIAQKDPSFTG